MSALTVTPVQNGTYTITVDAPTWFLFEICEDSTFSTADVTLKTESGTVYTDHDGVTAAQAKAVCLQRGANQVVVAGGGGAESIHFEFNPIVNPNL